DAVQRCRTEDIDDVETGAAQQVDAAPAGHLDPVVIGATVHIAGDRAAGDGDLVQAIAAEHAAANRTGLYLDGIVLAAAVDIPGHVRRAQDGDEILARLAQDCGDIAAADDDLVVTGAAL